MNFQNQINRRKSRQIMVGNVAVGGDAPISVQSMTNTLTTDVKATLNQIKQLQDSGADIVRVSVPDQESADAFKKIKKSTSLPLVADIHFDYMMALEAIKGKADCIRINPGNIGKEEKIKEVISAAKDNSVPIRVGVNAGSLERKLQIKYGEPTPDALVESALNHIDILKKLDFEDFKLSIKASDVFMTIESYRKISKLIDQPLHLGITEAGGYRSGTVKSSVGLGSLLLEGIGDTIRISLASDPVDEVKVGWDILKSLKIRSRGINFIACPSCSRMNFDVIGTMNKLESRLDDIKEDLDVAVIGCYVNGPGESKHTAIGVTGGSPKNLIYIDGKPDHKIDSAELAEHLESLIRDKIDKIKEQENNVILKS
ncbi:MAG: flavodoxin-dependent (E)-4-hydroxy-3-methylbut-2-enyl-diphosphate synthase [Gammaproteobacteria bacterium]|nr:MAG: flavodoxin-dependent (E)-4-hydroxy-3-methylbut-2-enyl-diphosphate synthase [Gammaproteobacteria bacterium]